MKHYHVRAGQYGRLPNLHHVAGTRKNALEQLQREVGAAHQGPEATRRAGHCHSGWVQERAFHIRLDRGTSYVEIAECRDPSCLPAFPPDDTAWVNSATPLPAA